MLASQFSYLEARIDLFNTADKSKMGTAEMKFPLKAAGHTLLDQIDIRTIRNELRVFDIGIKISDRIKNWHGQLGRMNSAGWWGCRDVGWPRSGWENGFGGFVYDRNKLKGPP